MTSPLTVTVNPSKHARNAASESVNHTATNLPLVSASRSVIASLMRPARSAALAIASLLFKVKSVASAIANPSVTASPTATSPHLAIASLLANANPLVTSLHSAIASPSVSASRLATNLPLVTASLPAFPAIPMHPKSGIVTQSAQASHARKNVLAPPSAQRVRLLALSVNTPLAHARKTRHATWVTVVASAVAALAKQAA